MKRRSGGIVREKLVEVSAEGIETKKVDD